MSYFHISIYRPAKWSKTLIYVSKSRETDLEWKNISGESLCDQNEMYTEAQSTPAE